MIAKVRLLFTAAALACAPALARAADPPLPAELDLIPRDADLVVSVRVAKLWKSELFHSYREMIAGDDAAFIPLFGYRPDDLERVTVAATGDDLLVILSTVKPTDR